MKTNNLLSVSVLLAGLLAAPLPVPASPALDLAKQLNQAFVEVADEVSPSVVVINVTQKLNDSTVDDEDSPWGELPPALRKQFRRQLEQHTPQKAHGQGSGVIIRKDGYILTNRHVIEDAEKIEVRLKDGRRFTATVRGEDQQSDVAVLKIEAKDLPVAKLGDSSQTRVGEFAIAIGAPFSLDYSVTFGHVSAKGRSRVIYDPMMDQEFIQTDANINPGNSGGPLVNINGEVIGINTLIHSLHTGIGFAIPVNLAREVADKLIADGRFARSWIGIEIASFRDSEDFDGLIKGVNDGVIVKAIDPDGPSGKSNLKPVDVITAVDGTSVSTAQQLKDEIRRKQIGQEITLDVVRNGKPIKIKVLTAERMAAAEPEARPVMAREEDDVRTSGLGIEVRPLTHQLADQLDTPMVPGVIVTGVEAGSMADHAHIKPGDIITEVGQQPVTSPKEFHAAFKNADLKKGIIVNFVNGKNRRFELLKDGDE